MKEKCRELLKYINVFENDSNYGEWHGGLEDKKPGEIMTLPYVKYSKNVMNFIDDVYNKGLIDFNYLKNHKEIEDKSFDDYTIENIITKLTFYIRGERFCDGLLYGAFEDETILKLLKILKERVDE